MDTFILHDHSNCTIKSASSVILAYKILSSLSCIPYLLIEYLFGNSKYDEREEVY